MNDEKITVSLDEVNSAKVDFEIHRQDIASRMSEHQAYVESNTTNNRRMSPTGGFFRRSIVYMTIAGFIFSVVAWAVGEILYRETEKRLSELWNGQREVCRVVSEKYPYVPTSCQGASSELGSQDKYKLSVVNPDFYRLFNEDEKRRFEAPLSFSRKRTVVWYAIAVLLFAICASSTEDFISRNYSRFWGKVLCVSIVGIVLGNILGYFIEHHVFLRLTNHTISRVLAYSMIGIMDGCIAGCFGKSWRKWVLACAGGLIGGAFGGLIFSWVDSDRLGRLGGLVSTGLFISLSITLLEDVAKQGWLKVATGIITGKQFILYRNPTIIGSSPKSEIYLFKDPAVAPKHAAINGIGGNFLLTALNDSQVLVNGTPVRQQTLKTGDQIRIGQTVFLFEARTVKRD